MRIIFLRNKLIYRVLHVPDKQKESYYLLSVYLNKQLPGSWGWPIGPSWQRFQLIDSPEASKPLQDRGTSLAPVCALPQNLKQTNFALS